MRSKRFLTPAFVAMLVTVAIPWTRGDLPAPTPVSPAPNAEALDDYHRTPLMLAAFRGDADAVQALLDRGAAVNARDKNGMTALMWTAPALAPLLLKRGADPRARDKFGCTALHYAAYRNDQPMVGKLLSAGGRVDDRDLDGLTPLCFAIYAECLWSGSGRSDHPPREARILGDLKQTMILKETGPFAFSLLIHRGANVNARDHLGRTPLIFFAQQQMFTGLPLDRQLVEELLAKGANINAQDHEGSTALMVWAGQGDARMAEFVLEHGADTEVRDRTGRTALICAAGGHTFLPAAVKALLARGAKVDATDQEGRTALWYAAQSQSREIVDVLKQAGAKE